MGVISNIASSQTTLYLQCRAVFTCCLNGHYFDTNDKAGYGDYNKETRAEECAEIANNLADLLD